ncbi:MAG: PepSY domain-containing protein [bacterium]|nr:PepSY domain-containing protein [bacterium]
MKASLLNRRTHYWATALVALPVLVIITTGLMLQVKKHWTWVQPPEQRGTGTVPVVGFETILDGVRAVPALQVAGWDDVRRLDVRPGRGVAKVWLKNGWEAQVDLGTGRVLQSAYRRSDLIESLHDGSFFGGEAGRLGVFLPAGIILLVMWMTGIWMFAAPLLAKRRRNRLRRPEAMRRAA